MHLNQQCHDEHHHWGFIQPSSSKVPLATFLL
jgi:hypothetical protein